MIKCLYFVRPSFTSCLQFRPTETSLWIKRILEDMNIVSVMIRTKKVITTSLDR